MASDPSHGSGITSASYGDWCSARNSAKVSVAICRDRAASRTAKKVTRTSTRLAKARIAAKISETVAASMARADTAQDRAGEGGEWFRAKAPPMPSRAVEAPGCCGGSTGSGPATVRRASEEVWLLEKEAHRQHH